MTALGFYSGPTGTQLVLAGEGCFLKVFEAESSKLICSIKAFKDQTIHGILVREDERRCNALQIAIWGGCLLTLLEKEAFDALLLQKVSSVENSVRVVSDWILDVAISPYDDICVLVTAHNTVLRAWLQNDDQIASLEELSSPSRSILYSAHLVWESPTCVLVAAGTVFGEIIAWECSISNEISPAGCRVLATLTGHEGSIFGVNISPLVYGLYDKPVRLLASCSDDRTIRIWDIRGHQIEDIQGDSDIHGATSLRETGFGDNGQNGDSSSLVDRCLAMVMGHVSRIWRVKFHISNLDGSASSSVRVFSFGEDSTAQQWALDFGTLSVSSGSTTTPVPSKSCSLSHLTTFAYHSGKHIWSTAMHKMSDTKTILVTGGADGKISSYDIPLISSSDITGVSHTALHGPDHTVQDESDKIFPQSKSLHLEDILSSVGPDPRANSSITKPEPLHMPAEEPPTVSENGKPAKKIKPPKIVKDAFNRYAFVTDSDMLVTTNFGRVLLGRIGSSIKWEELLLPEVGEEDLRSYSVIKGIPQRGVAFLAGANGNIYIYRTGSSITKIGTVRKKVADIFSLFNTGSRRIDVAATTLGGDAVFIFSVDQSSTPPLVESTISYGLPEKFIVTSVGKSDGMFVFGARNGSLAIYDEGNSLPIKIWKPEGDNFGDAITSITPVPSSNSDHRYFLTTARNGTYSIFAVTVTHVDGLTTGSTIRQIHRGTPPLGPNIEEAWFEGPDLHLYGFKSKTFIVWNETKQQEIMNIECGGAHRSYAYSHLQNSSGGHFIYTKASKLYVHSWRSASHRIIKSGGHGREIKACATSPDQSFIATGAEDTTLRIWRYSDEGSVIDNYFDCLAVVQKHTAGIQHVQWCGSTYLFSSAGNEEFFVWAVEYIPGFGMGIVCEASNPDASKERDLRIMSFDVTEDKRASGVQNEPQLMISMAYSDSTIRTYRYSKSNGFALVARGRYTSSCLLQLRHVQLSQNGLHIVTAATDGNLIVWKASSSNIDHDASQQLARLSTHKLHQNSIKCLDVAVSKSTKSIIVATGGDDNALAITIYDAENVSLRPRSIILRSAHAAAVTGLCLMLQNRVSEGRDEELRITSSSNDQRVKEWSFQMNKEAAADIELVGDAFTSVADVGDLTILRAGAGGGEAKVLIVGNGMEAYSVSWE